MPGMLYAAILRSPHAAAKIRSIDISKAKALKGVHAVFVGEDTKDAGAVPCASSLPGLRVPHHNVLAIDRVYLVGHPVAVVVATDRYIARDGAELIEVDYEVENAVADPEKALAPGAHAVHPQWPDNVAFNFHQEGGDVAKAEGEFRKVVSKLDKTASKGTIHKNTASRKRSRLALKLNAARANVGKAETPAKGKKKAKGTSGATA